ncbi:MAG: ferredoxin, partial [Rhodobacteraceae bacterium]|nr:ferredoxin [Paracoccaceae bacterium]
MTYDEVEQAVTNAGLIVMGAVTDKKSLVLLGTGPAFWPMFSKSSERLDGMPDPVDRWSLRVVGGLAKQLDAKAVYPFGGPPYEPFIRWAQASGRAFQSPVGMLVHDTVGMMVSYRG